MAASAASYFAAAEIWDIVTVEDITTWMAHRPTVCGCGDYEEFEMISDFLKRSTQLYANIYSSRSGIKIDEMLSMMKKTTYLFGLEVVKNGFADEVVSTDTM